MNQAFMRKPQGKQLCGWTVGVQDLCSFADFFCKTIFYIFLRVTVPCFVLEKNSLDLKTTC